MVVIPGLSESLGAVGKRIIHVDSTDTLLLVQAASSLTVRKAGDFRQSRHVAA